MGAAHGPAGPHRRRQPGRGAGPVGPGRCAGPGGRRPAARRRPARPRGACRRRAPPGGPRSGRAQQRRGGLCRAGRLARRQPELHRQLPGDPCAPAAVPAGHVALLPPRHPGRPRAVRGRRVRHRDRRPRLRRGSTAVRPPGGVARRAAARGVAVPRGHLPAAAPGRSDDPVRHRSAGLPRGHGPQRARPLAGGGGWLPRGGGAHQGDGGDPGRRGVRVPVPRPAVLATDAARARRGRAGAGARRGLPGPHEPLRRGARRAVVPPLAADPRPQPQLRLLLHRGGRLHGPAARRGGRGRAARATGPRPGARPCSSRGSPSRCCSSRSGRSRASPTCSCCSRRSPCWRPDCWPGSWTGPPAR